MKIEAVKQAIILTTRTILYYLRWVSKLRMWNMIILLVFVSLWLSFFTHKRFSFLKRKKSESKLKSWEEIQTNDDKTSMTKIASNVPNLGVLEFSRTYNKGGYLSLEIFDYFIWIVYKLRWFIAIDSVLLKKGKRIVRRQARAELH